MTALITVSAVASIPGWAWALVGLLVGLGVAIVLRRSSGNTLGRLWDALGKSQDGAARSGGDAWSMALDAVAQQREAAMRSQRLLLRANAIDSQYQITKDVLAVVQDGILVLDHSEQILFANDTARRVLGLGDRHNLTLEQAEASFEILDGIRSVVSADLGRTVKSRRIEWEHEGHRFVFVLRCLEPQSSPARQSSMIVVLEDLTAEERAARAKSEFIYGVSHELKTPLTAIQASLEMATEDKALSTEDRDRLIGSAYAESVRLSQMVTELLDLARVEAGITEFKRETVAMDKLLAGLKSFHEPLAKRKSIVMQWDVSDYLPDLVGDQRLLRQAFVNVIGNAVKYTKEGGEVGLTARLEGSDLVVRVRDTGIGISKEDLPRVFEKFFRASSATQSRIQGTGLGLPMARYIVERHQGRIELTSELGVGSEFAVFLPARSSDSEAEDLGSRLVAVDGAGS